MYKKYKVEFTISDYDLSDENYSEMDFDDNNDDDDIKHDKGFIESIKKEQRLTKKYQFSYENQKYSHFVLMFLTEIIDKIYIIKILLFTRKFHLLTYNFQYICYVILLLFLVRLFFI